MGRFLCKSKSDLVDEDIGASGDGMTGAAAMLGFVIQTDERLAIDENIWASFVGIEGIGSAASRVNSRVTLANRIE